MYIRESIGSEQGDVCLDIIFWCGGFAGSGTGKWVCVQVHQVCIGSEQKGGDVYDDSAGSG